MGLALKCFTNPRNGVSLLFYLRFFKHQRGGYLRLFASIFCELSVHLFKSLGFAVGSLYMESIDAAKCAANIFL